VLMIAEESTSWPGVSHPIERGGLGYDFKWNLGWMHDTLQYFGKDALYRQFHHNNLTFGFVYAWSENFILPFSHDEVVHLKGSMLAKMQGNREQKFANLRALYGYLWAHPGKKLLFMGGELGQWREWNDDQSLDWHLLDEPPHRGVQRLVSDLNRLYAEEPALWEADVDPAGFEWIDANSAAGNIIAFIRNAPAAGRHIVCVCNFSTTLRKGYRLALPSTGNYRVILNTDAAVYDGSDSVQLDWIEAKAVPLHLRPSSALIDLPPLSTIWLEVPRALSSDDGLTET